MEAQKYANDGLCVCERLILTGHEEAGSLSTALEPPVNQDDAH